MPSIASLLVVGKIALRGKVLTSTLLGFAGIKHVLATNITCKGSIVLINV